MASLFFLIRQKKKSNPIQLAAEQGKVFNASEGWFSRWKVRHNVVQPRDHGEKQVTDTSATGRQ